MTVEYVPHLECWRLMKGLRIIAVWDKHCFVPLLDSSAERDV